MDAWTRNEVATPPAAAYSDTVLRSPIERPKGLQRSKAMEPVTIMLVEDEALLLFEFEEALTEADFNVIACSSGTRGVPNSIVLEKPFAIAQLITAISQLLNGPLAVASS